MRLWLLERADKDCRYDHIHSAVVAATTEKDARRISPVDLLQVDGGEPSNLTVKLIGDAAAGISEGSILVAILHG